jgi:hypothetical protein
MSNQQVTTTTATVSTPTPPTAAVACFEGFRDLKQSEWTQLPFSELVKQVVPDSLVAYTRGSYVSRVEFKKLVDEAGHGQPVKTPRRRVICKVKDVGSDLVNVQSRPRKMTALDKEHKTYTWALREGMRGEPVYYLKH